MLFEAKTDEHLFDVGVHGKAAAACIHVVRICQALDDLHVVVCFVVRTRGQLVLQPLDLVVQLQHLFKGHHGRLAKRLAHVQRKVLRQQSDADAVLLGHFAGGSLKLAGDDAHHGGLAGTVAAYKADTVAVLDQEVDSFEQHASAEVNGDVR